MNEILKLEKWMLKPSNDDIMILEEPILDVNEKRHILVTHNESVFYANNGRLKFEEEEAYVIMKPGVNRNGWWKTDDLIKQVTELYSFIVLFINILIIAFKIRY